MEAYINTDVIERVGGAASVFSEKQELDREVRTLRESECYIESRSVLVTVYLKYIILYCGVIMCVRLVLQSVLFVCNHEPMIGCSRVKEILVPRSLRSSKSCLYLPVLCGQMSLGIDQESYLGTLGVEVPP